MKQKIAIGVIILLIVLVGLLLIFNSAAGSKTVLFEGTNYPVTVVTKKSGLNVTVKAKADQDVPWTVYAVDSDIVEINLKGSQKAGSEKYKVSPLKDGVTYIHFEKVKEAYGYEQTIVSMDVPVAVIANGDKLEISLMEGESFYLGGGNFVANNSEFPFILKSNGAAADIAFINGMGDWTIDTMDAPIRYEISAPEEGETIVRLYYFEREESSTEEGEEGSESASTEPTKPYEEMTDEEKFQYNIEQNFGELPEEYTYENIFLEIDPNDLYNELYHVYDGEGNDITEDLRTFMQTGVLPESMRDENYVEPDSNTAQTEESAETEEAAEETAEETEAATEEVATEEKAAEAAETEDEAEEETAEEPAQTGDGFSNPDDIILTKINFHSDSLNETVYIDVVIDTLGNLYLTKGKAPN